MDGSHSHAGAQTEWEPQERRTNERRAVEFHSNAILLCQCRHQTLSQFQVVRGGMEMLNVSMPKIIILTIQLADAALPTLLRDGFEQPFGATAAIVREADLAIANGEAPITDEEAPDGRWKEYVYRAPAEAAPALARAGFDLIGLANNHATDHGARGVDSTVENLRRAGVIAPGAGDSEATARRAVIVRTGGVRVGLIARCAWSPGWDLWSRQYARGSDPGVALLDEDRLREDVARLRPEVDLVVLFVHWGESYEGPTGSQRRWARRAAEAGVDLVVGHHPHVAQPVAMVGRTPVVFSLGNYAFGTPGRPELSIGLLLRVEVQKRRLARLELLPIDVQNRRVLYRPVPLVGSPARDALTPIVAASRALGAPLVLDGDRAVLELGAQGIASPADR
mgnify:CR=1 FL=1